MVRQGLEQFGHIDILVNSVGSRPGRDRVPVVELEEDAWDKGNSTSTPRGISSAAERLPGT